MSIPDRTLLSRQLKIHMESHIATKTDRPFQFSLFALLVFTAIAAIVCAHPLPVLAAGYSLAALVLAGACIWAAASNRVDGWVSGLLIGVLFTVVALAACVASLGLIVTNSFGR